MTSNDDEPAPDIYGLFDGFREGVLLHGWVTDRATQKASEITVFATLNGVEIGRTLANRTRDDGFRGYHLQLSQIVSNEQILREDVRIWANAATSPPTRIPLYSKFRESLLRQAIIDLGTLVETSDLRKFALDHLSVPIASPPPAPPASSRSPNVQVASSRDISFLGLRVGTVCSDDSAIIGREGNLFIYRGGNNLHDLYLIPPTSERVLSLSTRWSKIFARRAESVADLGAGYIQLVIPDKSSVYADLFPLPISAPTSLLEAIESQNAQISYFSAYKSLTRRRTTIPYFFKTDSHLNDLGCVEIMQGILERMIEQRPTIENLIGPGLRLLVRQDLLTGIRFVSGDLSRRFFNVPIYERAHAVPKNLSEEFTKNIRIIDQHTPSSGLSETKIVYSNPDAPIKMKIVAFANSFFERGVSTSNLTWWGKALFSEFHFMWKSNCNLDYISHVRPDFVICQTVERFLTSLPEN